MRSYRIQALWIHTIHNPSGMISCSIRLPEPHAPVPPAQDLPTPSLTPGVRSHQVPIPILPSGPHLLPFPPFPFQKHSLRSPLSTPNTSPFPYPPKSPHISSWGQKIYLCKIGLHGHTTRTWLGWCSLVTYGTVDPLSRVQIPAPAPHLR